MPPARAHNIWTHEQRHVLWQLKRNSGLEWPQRVAVFNDIFKDELSACGLSDGITTRQLQAQCAKTELERKSWQLVTQPPATINEEELRNDLNAKIQTSLATSTSKAPPTTPNTSRKRSKAVVPPTAEISRSTANAEDDDDQPPARSTRKRRRVIDFSEFEYNGADEAVVAVVTTPRRRSSLATPRSNSSQSSTMQRKKAREGANVAFTRYDGSQLMLYQHEADDAILDLVMPTEESVKPELPPLLFRYWDLKSQGLNSPERFVCGRYKNALTRPRPAPKVADLEWNDVAWHLDHRDVPTPFISTSSMLVWVLKKALTSYKLGERTGYVSVLDTAHILREEVFHVAPLHNTLRKQRPFTKGGYNYTGTSEHLVWHKIDQAAIVHTFSVQDLIRLARTPSLDRYLRLETIANGTVDKVKFEKRLKEDKLLLAVHIDAIAQIVLFVGPKFSDFARLWYLCYEVIRGWEIKIDEQSSAEWTACARSFAHSICKRRDEPTSLADQAIIMEAFRYALKWSLGGANARYKPEEIRLMEGRASKKGLQDEAGIVAKELSDAHSALDNIWRQGRQSQVLTIRDSEAELSEHGTNEDVEVAELIEVRQPAYEAAMSEEIVYGTDSDEEYSA